ncbi:MAG: nickel pincer cofactor biosynthesis protein LarC [Clostridiales bacterium]|nr:nickel pincer cofactor biosynthesis protein LarC [Clostridiales bacterium]
MKTLYIECNMGAAGDMLLASLAELTGGVKACEEKLNSIGIPGVTYNFEKSVKCGIEGTHAHVVVNGIEEDEHMHEHHDHEHSHEHDHHHEDHHHEHTHEEHAHTHEHEHEHGEHHHHHTHMSDIESIINGLNVSDKVKADALAVYSLIAEAESKAHGKPVTDIHFHEVGTMDAVADIVGVCILLEQIGADRIVVSPLATGFGQVKCAHGILPVPAPATASIIEGIPTYTGSVEGELLTPTGAALLKHFADSFGSRPVMAISKTGYGMGKKDFEKANMLRTFIGEEQNEDDDKVIEMSCNVDDMTGEEIGYATGILLNSGALDVFTTPVYMKKNRPGILITVIVKPEDKDKFAKLIFEHTTTIGIRYTAMDRFKLARHGEKVMTKFGEVSMKVSEGFGVTRVKPEYDDVAGIVDKE